MANINGAFGLRPVAKLGQGANSTGTSGYTPYEIANGNSNVIYHGSPVIPLSTGYIDIVGAAAGGSVSLVGAVMGMIGTGTQMGIAAGTNIGMLGVTGVNVVSPLEITLN